MCVRERAPTVALALLQGRCIKGDERGFYLGLGVACKGVLPLPQALSLMLSRTAALTAGLKVPWFGHLLFIPFFIFRFIVPIWAKVAQKISRVHKCINSFERVCYLIDFGSERNTLCCLSLLELEIGERDLEIC